MEKPKMFKKFLTLLMPLTLILSLADCGSGTAIVKVTSEDVNTVGIIYGVRPALWVKY